MCVCGGGGGCGGQSFVALPPPSLRTPLPHPQTDRAGWKFIRFGPDGKLYVPIGANCNICKLTGSPPTNGTVDGQFIYSVAASSDPTLVHAPYQKTPSSPVFEFGSIYRMVSVARERLGGGAHAHLLTVIPSLALAERGWQQPRDLRARRPKHRGL